ncbi:MAG TPA: HAMP domain-containing sensor histidine kinase [Myxococcales bacterium]|nr:HAMP domain-containing sensor histidine kinase [Myxococcales bacterium]
MHGRARGHHSSPTLFRRFYVHTLLVVLLCTGIVFAGTSATRMRAFREELARVGAGVGKIGAAELGPVLGDTAKRHDVLERLADPLDARLAIFGADQQALDSVGEPLPTPSAQEFADAAHSGSAVGWKRHQGHWVLVPIERDGALAGYLQGSLRFRLEPASLWRAAGSFALLLVLVALLMAPAARSVTRPLEELTRSARRFGAGDFAHRAEVRGRDEIARLASAMNEMAERLSALLHTQRELLANVSHELRSPLARIQVALELARGQERPDGPLDEIAQDIAELSRLVDDVLATSRLELRPESVRPARLSLRDLLGQARRRALAGGLAADRLSLELADDLPDVTADGELCAHALGNLLDNARKHTPPGTAVALGATREGERVRIFVRDHGPGLPAEELPRLFEPFYRPDASRTRSTGGAGLGLSLVRRIAELHGAEPRVESAPGQGSTFSFTLPIAPESDAAA